MIMRIRQVVLLLCLSALHLSAHGQTTAFTYQGRLTDAGNPANGNYDLQFKLFDAAAGGAQQGSTLVRTPVVAVAGNFTVTLDFGADVFSGADRYLEIGVRPAGNAGAYTVLAPRQLITSSPYAIQTLNANQLGGLPASRFVQAGAGGNVGIGFDDPPARLGVLSTTPGDTAIYGESATGRAIWGKSTSSRGVYGESDTNAGVWGFSPTGTGVVGQSTTGFGVQGTTASNTNFAGQFINTGNGHALYAEGLSGRGVWGKSAFSRGVYGESISNAGVWGFSDDGAGVVAESTTGFGIQATTGSPTSFAGQFTNTGGGHGIYSETTTGRALWGKSASSRAVFGESVSNVGVWGVSGSSTGVIGVSTSGYGVDGSSASPNGFGGHFSNTGGGKALRVDGTGSVGVLEITNGSDLAERFEVADETKPGMVVVIDPASARKLSISHRPYDRRVAGIISGANNLSAGMLLPDLTDSTNAQPIALSGRVWVYCDATKNPITPGDLLTTASIPGHAMKVINRHRAQGAIIGKAMTELKSGTGLVLVLVSLQ
jgi:hypothetical protein